jgi:hypothetical protein
MENKYDVDPLDEPFSSLTEPDLIPETDLSDLVHDLNLRKNQIELLASRLKGWYLLEKCTKIYLFCKHQKVLQFFFSGKQFTVL